MTRLGILPLWLTAMMACSSGNRTEPRVETPSAPAVPAAEPAAAPSPEPAASAPLDAITWDDVADLVPTLRDANLVAEPTPGPATQLRAAYCVRGAPTRAVERLERRARQQGWTAPRVSRHPDGGDRFGLLAQQRPYVLRADVGPGAACGANRTSVVVSLYKAAAAPRRPRRSQ